MQESIFHKNKNKKRPNFHHPRSVLQSKQTKSEAQNVKKKLNPEKISNTILLQHSK